VLTNDIKMREENCASIVIPGFRACTKLNFTSTSVAPGARVGCRIPKVEAATVRNEDDDKLQELFEVVCQVRDFGIRCNFLNYRET